MSLADDLNAVKARPEAGDRVGRVCGPGRFPEDDQGKVMTCYVDAAYGYHIAVVLMDIGTVEFIYGSYCAKGIGWRVISPGTRRD